MFSSACLFFRPFLKAFYTTIHLPSIQANKRIKSLNHHLCLQLASIYYFYATFLHNSTFYIVKMANGCGEAEAKVVHCKLNNTKTGRRCDGGNSDRVSESGKSETALVWVSVKCNWEGTAAAYHKAPCTGNHMMPGCHKALPSITQPQLLKTFFLILRVLCSEAHVEPNTNPTLFKALLRPGNNICPRISHHKW